MSGEPEVDPAITAIMDYVDAMCLIAVATATGFYTASTTTELSDAARSAFITAMNKATQDAGP